MLRTARADKQIESPQATQAVFTNSAPITINDDDNATPYPSSIVASGLVGNIPATPGSVKVTLNGFSHTFPDDVGIVLVGPTGAALLLQDGCGEDEEMVNVTYSISDSGATTMPDLTAWPAGTYKPTTYYINDPFPAPGPGTAYGSPGPAGGGTATFSSVFGGTNPNGTWNLFIIDFVGGDDGDISGGWSLEINTGAAATPQHVVDFDGDGKTDAAVVRNTGGGPTGQLTWFIQNSGGAPPSIATPWGLASDKYTPADFDGDNKTDIAIFRPGPPSIFYILQSQTGTLRMDQFGLPADDSSVVGDYDGDGKADTAVYRLGTSPGDPSFWYYHSSMNGSIVATQWGQTGDFPAPGDYDGDHKFDFAIQRNNGGGQARFFILRTTAGVTSVVFGTPTDIILPGDYDGDGKTDIVTLRGSGGQILWNILRSSDGVSTQTLFGLSALDFPTQGDYDGDGKTDIAVWRADVDPNVVRFYIRNSGTGTDTTIKWGQNGDYPPANFNAH